MVETGRNVSEDVGIVNITIQRVGDIASELEIVCYTGPGKSKL